MTNNKQNSINSFGNNVEAIAKSPDTKEQGSKSPNSDERRKNSKDSALFLSLIHI